MNQYNNSNNNRNNFGNNNRSYDNRNQGYQKQESFSKPLKDFFTENGVIKIEWIDQTINEFAKHLGNNCDFRTSQLRNFYNEFLRIKNIPIPSEEKMIMIKMLKAKVNYKQSANNVPNEFKIFVSNLVDEIKSDDKFIKRFDNACILMEALVAFNPNTKK